MGKKVGEFFIEMLVDAASGNLSVRQLVAGLGELSVGSVGAVGSVAKITDSLWGMAKAATGTAIELSELHDITGVDPGVAEKWELAAQRINVSGSSIVGAIKGVNAMMGAVAAHKSAAPMELTSWLGILPQKGTDPKGNPVMKNFFDIMGEIAKPGSQYWKLPSDAVRQQILGGAFPGAKSDDLFRILNEMRAGKWKPGAMEGLSGKQRKDLVDIDKEWTETKQQVVDLFDHFLLAGDAVAEILKGANELLVAVKAVLDTPSVQKALHSVGAEVRGLLNGTTLANAGFSIYSQGAGGVADWAMGSRMGALDTQIALAAALKKDPTGGHGKLDITITDPRGNRKETFLKLSPTNAHVEHVTVNAGNGGQGQ